MALRNTILFFLVTMALCGGCHGAVHRVGESDGWTIRGLVDYNMWASTKEFHMGDTLVFTYNNQFHNVMQVSDQDFQLCNTLSAIATYTSGSDIITLNKTGHYYFLCGTPDHCQIGQKLDIEVTLPVSDDYLSTSPSPTPSSFHSVLMPPSSSTPSSAPIPHSSKLGLFVTTLVLCLMGFVF